MLTKILKKIAPAAILIALSNASFAGYKFESFSFVSKRVVYPSATAQINKNIEILEANLVDVDEEKKVDLITAFIKAGETAGAFNQARRGELIGSVVEKLAQRAAEANMGGGGPAPAAVDEDHEEPLFDADYPTEEEEEEEEDEDSEEDEAAELAAALVLSQQVEEEAPAPAVHVDEKEALIAEYLEQSKTSEDRKEELTVRLRARTIDQLKAMIARIKK